jgi:hypothetical protein
VLVALFDFFPFFPVPRAAQEPENAHSHLLSMVLGNSETIPITQGQLTIGTWQVRGRQDIYSTYRI